MAKLYHILAEKAMVATLGVVFFLSTALPAFARVPNDPFYASQASVWNQIGAPKAWDYAVGSLKVIVAVIDTGVDTWHPDLVDSIWVNAKEIADNGIDDDHNGFIDDLHGWNFVEDNNDPRTSVFNVGDDKESVRHGTVIAGLIGESGNNGLDGTGLNWYVRIMPLRAITSAGTGALSNVTRAVDYAVANGANVISMSFVGKTDEPSLRAALYRAYQKGVVVVAAAGNHEQDESGDLNKTPEYPACYDLGQTQNWILTVTSVDALDQISYFSNTGKCIDIAAPGETIYSTERYAPQYGYVDEFGGEWEGTSFAAPLVAGAAALLKSVHLDWSPDQIITTLLTTADPIAAKNPRMALTYGRLNIGTAVAISIATTTAILPTKLLYTVDKSIVRQVDPATKKSATAAIIEGATLTSAVQLPNLQQFAVLIKRQKTWSVQVYDLDGRLDHEIALSLAEQKGGVFKTLRATDTGGFIVEQTVAKNKQLISLFVDQNGKKLKEVTTKLPK